LNCKIQDLVEELKGELGGDFGLKIFVFNVMSFELQNTGPGRRVEG
jgi:hypothetical protein